ncbi:hypothetical protein TWF102_011856 [Orbilia oligospora]|uniref:Uncharacterized protein n=1 Tax=Orbilia oligospora TaxID=2813651 RepID=A0A7C8NXW5_ORBOL|nr:hypothetical protein TWF102_011856 [Orbilia oligospora]KAF3111106.1 hypothetical protein TWF103_003793 [Orbilia oligospora]KAF3115600.1 hypothetical protein TWF706_005718 [Orbilia oligospora]KAF3119064.1 hypothetical protein TWF594_005275 [Orbilia oligospora]KAF3139809.1 hypothetical protein TWF703_003387 [Orbilia oligospora]
MTEATLFSHCSRRKYAVQLAVDTPESTNNDAKTHGQKWACRGILRIGVRPALSSLSQLELELWFFLIAASGISTSRFLPETGSMNRA